MHKNLYVNTSKLSAVLGFIAITVATTYASTHADQIVNGVVNSVKDGAACVNAKLHQNKQQYILCARDADGKIYDTGKRIWK